MIAMFVVSIITGIICDTFGELRGEMDEAAGYRASTNFITGIPFAEMCVTRPTSTGWLALPKPKRSCICPYCVCVCVWC